MAGKCARCAGEGWVCESHPSRPWGGLCCDGPRWAQRLRPLSRLAPWGPALLPYRGPFRLAWRIRPLCEHGACYCGGAGLACPDCNPDGHVDWLSVITETA